jgi:3-hydroxyisobutyrate dehydrogenase-like beta-hydroxyacid dehydrogenase
MRITLLGLGLLGRPIALRLVHCGHDLVAWNRSPESLQKAAEAGLTTEADLERAVVQGEVIILTLSDAGAIDEVLFDQRVIPLLGDKTVLQMGTIAPEESRTIARRVAQAGGEYLETPVLGSIPEARSGQLIVMAAGKEPVYQHCLLLLRCLGKEVELVGTVGQAAAMKLAMNQLIASLTVGFSHSLGLVRAEGVEVDQFMKLLRESALYAPTFDKKLQKFMEHDYARPNFPLKHLVKDMSLFRRVAEAAGIEAIVADALLAVCVKGQEAGYGEEDYSALYEAVNPGFDAETDIGC